MHCKSLWIKASAKYVNVNVNVNVIVCMLILLKCTLHVQLLCILVNKHNKSELQSNRYLTVCVNLYMKHRIDTFLTLFL